MVKQFLLASDFDQTLSFNDSGVVLSELIGFHGFHDKVAGLSGMNLVQQGAELSYLILHDPEFRRVRREHLIETGKRIRLKHDVALFARALESLADGYKFSFYVISAAPQEIIQSALEGIVPRDHIFGTRFRYNEATGEVDSIIRASAGWGKITVLEELRAQLGISHDQIIYMGDGSSDLPVMMHVNQYDGLTIAVSEAKYITRVAKRTVLSDNAMSVLVPGARKSPALGFRAHPASLRLLRPNPARMGKAPHRHANNPRVRRGLRLHTTAVRSYRVTQTARNGCPTWRSAALGVGAGLQPGAFFFALLPLISMLVRRLRSVHNPPSKSQKGARRRTRCTLSV